MPANVMYNDKAIPQLCEEQRPTPKAAHDLLEQIRQYHIKTADILASVFCILTGHTPDIPGYQEPESMLMDLACEAERAECILRMANDIREML